MIQKRNGAKATGILLLVLGTTMVLIIGRGDMTVILAGLLILISGVYMLSLVDPSTRRFMGDGWAAGICKTSAIIVGLLMMVSGLTSLVGGLLGILVSRDLEGLGVVPIGILTLCWGFYILHLIRKGMRD